MVVSYTTSPITGVNACRCAVVNLFIVEPLTAVDVNVNAVALAVPSIGVTNVGDVDSTVSPLPVDVVTPVPPLRTGNAVPLKVTANVPLVVIGLPDTDKNVGTVAATLVTLPFPLLLNVDQSVPERYPLTPPVAAGILMAGVVPPEDTTGDVPVTLVTVPFPLLLKVVQSAAVKAPLLIADELGRFNVWVVPTELTAKSVPLVPATIVCTAPVRELIAVIPVPARIPDCWVTVTIREAVDGGGEPDRKSVV